MTDAECLERAVALTGHVRYRWLASDANPDAEGRAAYRALVRRIASGEPEPTHSAPPNLVQKAANFAAAAVSHAAAGFPTLDRAETAARLAVCEPCEFRREGTCEICGCQLAVKASWADQECPKGKWPGREQGPAEPPTNGAPPP